MLSKITLEKIGPRVYFCGDTYTIRNDIKALGGHWDDDSRRWWVGATKVGAAEALIASTADQAPKVERPSDIRLTGKGTYQGRTYYLGASTRDGAKVRLLTLPDANGKYLDFWASRDQVEVVKAYSPRESRYRGHTTTTYTTLGSIADFVVSQRRAEKEGLPACAECGKRSAHLVRDMEDGMRKCHSCCDMPE